MFEIIFYRRANGETPVLDHLQRLALENTKDSRIRKNKALQYIKVLEQKGTRAGEPIVKHLDGDIWELRPSSDRILFAGLVGAKFVLLHVFAKKTQKTPKQEITQAKRELADFIERGE